MNTETKFWNKNFILYVIAFELAEMGHSLLSFAIPIYILIVTNDPTLVGTVMTISWLPFALFLPFGGVLADRFSKRKVIVLCNFLIAVAIGGYMIGTGNTDVLLLSVMMLVLMTILQSLQSPSFETVLYEIIPMEELMRANQVTWILMIGSGVLAPIIAGWLLSHFGLNVIMSVSMTLFLGATCLNIFLKIPFEKTQATKGIFSVITSDLKASFKFVWFEDEVLKKGTIGLVLYSLVLGPVVGIIPPIFINAILEMNERVLGFAQGLIALGGILGVMLLGRLGERVTAKKLSHLLISSSVTLIATTLIFMLVPSRGMAFVVLIFGSLAVNTILVMFSLNYFTYLGQNTPEEMVGKVMAFAMTVMLLAWSLAQFIVGRLFNLFENNLALAALVLPAIVLCLAFTTIVKEEKTV